MNLNFNSIRPKFFNILILSFIAGCEIKALRSQSDSKLKQQTELSSTEIIKKITDSCKDGKGVDIKDADAILSKSENSSEVIKGYKFMLHAEFELSDIKPNACLLLWLAGIDESGKSNEKKNSTVESRKLLGGICSTGSQTSCSLLGDIELVLGNRAKAMEYKSGIQKLFLTACERGKSEYCLASYRKTWDDTSGTLKLNEIKPIIDRACKHSSQACFEIAEHNIMETKFKLAGDALSCSDSTKYIVKKAKEFTSEKCKANEGLACFFNAQIELKVWNDLSTPGGEINLCEFSFSGKRVKQTIALGKNLLGKGCDQGNNASCAALQNLNTLYERNFNN